MQSPKNHWIRERFIVQILGRNGFCNKDAIQTLIKILCTNKGDWLRYCAAKSLKEIRQEEFLIQVVESLKSHFKYELCNQDSHLCQECKEVLLYCSQNLPYLNFYKAWHDGEDPTLSAEAQTLEAQNLDFNQLRPSAHTHPLAINLLSLKEETEPGAIAQKLCNKIYKHQAVKIPGKPPTVKSDAELQQHLFEIQDKLQRPNLALVLYIKDANGFHEPTEEAIAFCQKLADPDLGIHIAWITNQSLEQPLKHIQPDPAKLISKIQSWIDEIV